MSHTGRHPENWLLGIPSVQLAVQAAETSDVVAFVADAFTSVTVLAEPALPSDATAAEGLAYSAAKLLPCVVSSLSGVFPRVSSWVSPCVSGCSAERRSARARLWTISCRGTFMWPAAARLGKVFLRRLKCTRPLILAPS